MFTELADLSIESLSITEVIAAVKRLRRERAALDAIEARLAARANEPRASPSPLEPRAIGAASAQPARCSMAMAQ